MTTRLWTLTALLSAAVATTSLLRIAPGNAQTPAKPITTTVAATQVKYGASVDSLAMYQDGGFSSSIPAVGWPST